MAFKSLVSALAEQHQEIRQSLTLFPYFDTWDSKVVGECCKISTMMEFAPDEIILGEGSTNAHMTFFILEGVCRIIYHLDARVKVDAYGRTTYKLYKADESAAANSNSAGGYGYTSALFGKMHETLSRDDKPGGEEETSDVDEAQGNEPEDPGVSRDTPLEPGDEGEVAAPEEPQDNEETTQAQSERTANGEDGEAEKGDDETGNGEHEDGVPEETAGVIASPGEEIQDDGQTTEEGTGRELPSPEPEPEPETDPESEAKVQVTYEPDHHLKVLDECKAKSRQLIRPGNAGGSGKRPKNVQTFFIQVALFYKGACFGLEENLKDTFVMSATKVKCLRIPRRFLLQHNPCNIWNRIRLFFSLYLPTEKQILEYFASDRNWNKLKRKQTDDVKSLKGIPNYTLCSEVPYSIRLLEVPRC